MPATAPPVRLVADEGLCRNRVHGCCWEGISGWSGSGSSAAQCSFSLRVPGWAYSVRTLGGPDSNPRGPCSRLWMTGDVPTPLWTCSPGVRVLLERERDARWVQASSEEWGFLVPRPGSTVDEVREKSDRLGDRWAVGWEGACGLVLKVSPVNIFFFCLHRDDQIWCKSIQNRRQGPDKCIELMTLQGPRRRARPSIVHVSPCRGQSVWHFEPHPGQAGRCGWIIMHKFRRL